MKRIFYLLTLAFSLVFASCSNDPIGVEEGFMSDLKVVVKTSETYKNRSQTQLEGFMANDEDMFVGATSLLYDANGKLVQEITSTKRNFNLQEQIFHSVREGQYTLLTVVMFVYESEDFSGESIKITDKENLNSVKLFNPNDDELYFYECCGVATQTIKVSNDNTTTISIVPTVVGATIDLDYSNLNAGDGKLVSISVKRKALGYRLAPQLSLDDRVIYDENPLANNKWSWLGFRYNSKGLTTSGTNNESGFTAYSFNLGEQDILFGVSKMDDGDAVIYDYSVKKTFTFANATDYYSHVHYKSGNLETFISDNVNELTQWVNNLGNGSGSTSNEVSFKSPYITWTSGTVSKVQSHMSGYTLTKGSQGKAEYVSTDNNYQLLYQGKNDEQAYAYYFTSATGGLYQAMIVFADANISSLRAAVENQGYTFVGQQGETGGVVYTYTNNTTDVMVMDAGTVQGLVYIPTQTTRVMSKVPSESYQKMLQELKGCCDAVRPISAEKLAITQIENMMNKAFYVVKE